MVTGGGTVMPSVGGGGGGGQVVSSAPASCVASAMIATTPSEGLPAQQQRRPGENRRSNKPIMEKRRRARINNCLNELKTLILDAMKKDPARHSKLEKADILEMTVKHLETLQRQQAAMSAATDPTVVNKFRAGFNECAGEVGRFPGLDSPVRRRLLQHLANCLNGTPAPSTPAEDPPVTTPPPPPQPPQGIFLGSAGGGGLQLVPTRLPNGDIALVLPAGFRATTTTTTTTAPPPPPSDSPLPLLVPIPQRTASTASAASSTTSAPSSCGSPVAFERLTVRSPETAVNLSQSGEYRERPYSPPMSKPLALVIRKRVEEDEERPWRPW